MNIEIVKKLLKSPVREDVLIGLNIVRDWEWQSLSLLRDNTAGIFSEECQFLIWNNLKGDVDDDCYLLNHAHCHWNSSIFFYEGHPNRKIGYITL